MFMAMQQQVQLSSRFSRVCLIGCAVTLATIVFPHHVSANNLTICKKTVPSTGPTGPAFNFTGANSWTGSGKDFTTLYVMYPPTGVATTAVKSVPDARHCLQNSEPHGP